jgi:murein L,D-transpeptidase YcbB/YkuD
MLEGGGGGGGGNGAAAQSPEVSSQALQAAAREEPLRRFYEARQWQSAWNEQSAQQLVEALRGAVRHGLNPAQLTQEIDRARSPVDREVALSRAALTYADALARGRTDPTRLFEVYTVPRNEADVPGGLAQAVERGNVPEWIESLAPQDEEYRALSQAYVQHMQAMQQQGGGQQANPQGSQQAPAGNQAQAKADQPKEKNSQRRAQQAAPAVPRDRAVVLAVNLERRRWLPRSPDATRIDVNTAASFLRYYRDNAVVDQRVVANGEQGWETPQLASPIYRLVANPDWTVPESIERDELSKLSPAQLQRRNISRKGARMVQEPGPQNALGLVKLDMQNDHAIYLHDTPAKAAFQAADRHVSHGCVRVNDAVGFARMLAEHAGKLEEFNRALANPNRQTTFISLENRIPVRLLYHTAFLDGGQLKFNPDPYGWDATVAQALGLPVPPASQINQRSAEQKRQRRDSDFGP